MLSLFLPTCFNHLDVCVLRPVLIVLLSKAEVQGEKYYKVYVNIMQLLVVSSFFFNVLYTAFFVSQLCVM